MRALISVAALALSIGPAFAGAAGTFGDAEACQQGAPVSAPANYDGPLFFDGKLIYGPAWDCDLKGVCQGEDIAWHAEVSAKPSKGAVKIIIDGRTYSLPRCK